MRYSSTFNLIETKLSKGKSFNFYKIYKRIQIEPNHPSYSDSKLVFSQDRYKYPYLPLYLGQANIDINEINVNVLRLLIRENDYRSPLCLPKELLSLSSFCGEQINYHHQYFPQNKNCFLYLTIRVSEGGIYYANSQNWHVDGFQGSKIERHIPEQNILWSNTNPTEFSIQPYFIEGLNPSKHNIHDFFEDNTGDDFYTGVENGVYLITPYNVHRTSAKKFKGKRVCVRLNFSPVEIDDPTNTINPMLKRKYNPRLEIRDFLWDYKGEVVDGFTKG